MSKPTTNKFSAEVRDRAVRMVFDHQAEHPSQWAAINSIAGKIGCTGETLRSWVRRSERDQGLRAGPTTHDGDRIKALERENRELRQANEILRKASAYFAQAELEPRLEDLHGRVHRGAYRPRPSRRTYIPKADGKQRPLAIAALEDKIVQGATVIVLNAIYEGDFCGFSYGFRPGRGPHDALDALSTAIKIRKVNWIVDADIRDFFGAVSQDWLVRFLEHRIGDKRIIRLIQKWMRAGILEDGVVTVDDRGTGQGSVISPLLANIYLHYCSDLWA